MPSLSLALSRDSNLTFGARPTVRVETRRPLVASWAGESGLVNTLGRFRVPMTFVSTWSGVEQEYCASTTQEERCVVFRVTHCFIPAARAADPSVYVHLDLCPEPGHLARQTIRERCLQPAGFVEFLLDRRSSMTP